MYMLGCASCASRAVPCFFTRPTITTVPLMQRSSTLPLHCARSATEVNGLSSAAQLVQINLCVVLGDIGLSILQGLQVCDLEGIIRAVVQPDSPAARIRTH